MAKAAGEFTNRDNPPTRTVDGKRQYEFANVEEETWRHAYAVNLDSHSGTMYLINADSEQDAIDEAADLMYDRFGEKWFPQPETDEPENEGLESVGGHGQYLRSEDVNFWRMPDHPKAK